MRYSKRLILFFLLFSAAATAQWRPSPYQWQYNGVKVDGPLLLPKLLNNVAEDSTLYTDVNGYVRQRKNDAPVDTVLTITSLQSYNGKSHLVVVKDTLRGGLFMRKGVGIVDNGITFNGITGYWTRVGVNNAPANILWYGAIPNDGVNDNVAVTAAIATKRAVYVPDGTYLITSSQTLNDNQTIYGNGNTSVLQTTTANNIQIVNMGNYCTVRDLMFLGSGKGSTTPYVSLNGTQIGVRVLSKSRCLVSNCTFQALGGAGFYCQTTLNVSHEGSTVIACKADTCFNGFYSGTGGEYINYIACTAVRCDYGATFLGGNNKFNVGTLDNNQTGIRIISDRGNDAHGEVVGSTINHNYQYSVSIDSTLNSFYIGHNMMYYGKINIKKVINGVVFEGNDIASTDTIFINSSTNVQFVNNRFISTLPQFMKNWNGTSNANPVTSDVQMFNNKYVNVAQYNQSVHPQNQLLGGANIYGNTYIWGTKNGVLSTGAIIFQDSSGLRTGFYGDAATFDRNIWASCFNGSNIRFAGVGVDTANAPLTMNALFTGDGFFVFNDSIPYSGGYRPRFRLAGGLRTDSFFNAATPNAKNHFQGTFQLDIGSDAKYDIPYRDSATGNIARIPAGTYGQVLGYGPGGKPQAISLSGSSIPSGFATTTDANYTVQAADKFILLIQTSSLRTLTLPNPVGASGRELWIRCAATGSGQWQTGTTGFVGCGQLGTPPFSPSSNVGFSSNTTIHIISDGTSWNCFN